MRKEKIRQKNCSIKSWTISFILLFFCGNVLYANNDTSVQEVKQSPGNISGTIVDKKTNEPLIGVSVKVKDATAGTVSDINGSFSLNAPVGSTLVFSYVGYATQTIVVNSQAALNIAMQENTELMDEVVIVGYGVTKKASLTSAIANIKGDDISKNPVANISNTLAGRVAGIMARQAGGEPGEDGSTIYIRGRATNGKKTAPLVVIDGIPRENYSQLDPSSIESITVLKDAAAVAPYGLGGANGVLLVTTKKGKTGAPTINYNGYIGFQNPTRMAEMVNSYEYALMMNEGARNSGMSNMPFSEEEVANYKKTVDGAGGAHADRWPSSRGVRDIIQYNRPITNHSLEISGGTDKVNYYMSLAYLSQKGQFKTTDLKRYNVQSRLDVQATNTTKVSLSLSGYVMDQNYPAWSAERIMYFTTRTPPTHAIEYSNGLWGNYMGNSPVGAIEHSGYEKNDITQIYTTIEVEQQLPFLKGLSIKGVASYDPRSKFNKKWSTPILSYVPDYSTDPITFNETYNGSSSSLNEGNEYDKRFTYQAYINYKNTFNGLHDVSVLGVAERSERKFRWNKLGRSDYPVDIDEINFGGSAAGQMTNEGSSSQEAQVGFVYRLSYAYAGKYITEIAGRYDGSYYFAQGKKWAFFPSFSLAWNIAEENFVRNRMPYLNQLKLRASYGESGNLAGDAYQYMSGYGIYSNSAYFGGATTGINEKKQANPEITWEKAKKFDVGVDALLWNGKLSVTADYFYETRDNMLMAPTAIVPVEYGIELPEVNGGKMSNRGFDLALGSNFSIGKDWNIDLRGTLTYAKNKLERVYETGATYDNPNRRRTGRPFDTYFGYKAIGYFSEEDFDANGKLKEGIASIKDAQVAPGDIKYQDISGPDGVPDGIIDSNDETVIGRPKNNPQLIFGFSPTVTWKGIDFSMLLQGAGLYDSYLWGTAISPFDDQSSATKLMFEDHWTPENRNATYPRVTMQPLSHNTRQSSHWVRDMTYLRLKNIEVGYTLPREWTSKAAMSKVRIYFSGQNLWTWTPNMKEKLDPEAGDTNGWYYYQQSVFSFGANITF